METCVAQMPTGEKSLRLIRAESLGVRLAGNHKRRRNIKKKKQQQLCSFVLFLIIHAREERFFSVFRFSPAAQVRAQHTPALMHAAFACAVIARKCKNPSLSTRTCVRRSPESKTRGAPDQSGWERPAFSPRSKSKGRKEA